MKKEDKVDLTAEELSKILAVHSVIIFSMIEKGIPDKEHMLKTEKLALYDILNGVLLKRNLELYNDILNKKFVKISIGK